MPHIRGYFVAEASEAGVDLFRAIQRGRNVWQDVFGMDVLDEFRPFQQIGRLFARAAQQECTPAFTEARGESFQRVQAGGIESGHVSKAEYNDRRKSVKIRRRLLQL